MAWFEARLCVYFLAFGVHAGASVTVVCKTRRMVADCVVTAFSGIDSATCTWTWKAACARHDTLLRVSATVLCCVFPSPYRESMKVLSGVPAIIDMDDCPKPRVTVNHVSPRRYVKCMRYLLLVY